MTTHLRQTRLSIPMRWALLPVGMKRTRVFNGCHRCRRFRRFQRYKDKHWGRLLRRVPLPCGAVVSVFVIVSVVNDKIDNSMRALIRLEARILTCHRLDCHELRQPSGFRFRVQN